MEKSRQSRVGDLEEFMSQAEEQQE